MHQRNTTRHRGFTLVELLVVIATITLLASLVLAALYSAQESARIDKTKATINKINTLVERHMDETRTRRLPIYMTRDEERSLNGKSARTYAGRQLLHRWQIQRIEIPDRYEDIATDGMSLYPENARNPLRLAYQVQIKLILMIDVDDLNRPTMADVAALRQQNQSAECLYLAVTRGLITDDHVGFADHEFGDEDGDGMFEFIDGWGEPIEFLRWAPGYVPALDAVTEKQNNISSLGNLPDYPDTTFDPVGVGVPGNGNVVSPPGPGAPSVFGFKLFPLIVSAGPDGEYGVFFDSSSVNASNFGKHNNPYSRYDSGAGYLWRGTPVPGDEGGGHLDNITNHENLGARK